MADSMDNTGDGLPPKLDLRGSGILKESDAPAAIPASAPVAPKPMPTAVKPLAPKPAPVAAKPAMTEPAPATPAPLAPAAVKPLAPTPAPVAVKPLAPKPAPSAVKPLAPKPAPLAPAAVKPLTPKPAPVAVKPLAPKPAPLAPAAVKPSTPKPAPAAVKPLITKPGALAPKPTISKPEPVATLEDESSQTMHAQIPEDGATKPVSISKPQVPVSAPVDPKRETSKIPLGSAKPAPGLSLTAAADKSAVKVQPAGLVTSKAVKAIKPVAAAPAAVDEKRKTSRISLEAALAPSADGGSSAAPKTIKIKKPSEAPTIKATVDDSAKTAQLDEASIAKPSAGPATGRKTIKVKRPTQRPGVKGVTVKRPSEAGAPAAVATVAPVAQPVAGAEPVLLPLVVPKLNPFWPITALVTSFVIITTIYMFCSQAFGPNISLTELSYGAPGMDLPWVGKLRIME